MESKENKIKRDSEGMGYLLIASVLLIGSYFTNILFFRQFAFGLWGITLFYNILLMFDKDKKKK